MIHAILFPRLDFTVSSANQWLDNHGFLKLLKPIHIEGNYLRTRIHRQKKGVPFYSKRLPNGIILVLQED